MMLGIGNRLLHTYSYHMEVFMLLSKCFVLFQHIFSFIPQQWAMGRIFFVPWITGCGNTHFLRSYCMLYTSNALNMATVIAYVIRIFIVQVDLSQECWIEVSGTGGVGESPSQFFTSCLIFKLENWGSLSLRSYMEFHSLQTVILWPGRANNKSFDKEIITVTIR